MNRFFHAIYLAFQYQRHHKVRSLLLTLGVSVAVFLPAFTWSASELVGGPTHEPGPLEPNSDRS